MERSEVERAGTAGETEVVPLAADVPSQVASYLDLEMSAAEPYAEFLYGDPAVAAEAHRYQFDGGGESAPPAAHVLLVAGEVGAMAAWCRGEDVRERRLRGTLALTRCGLVREDPDLRRRLGLAADCLCTPGPEDHYLSRLAVAPHRRRQGSARRLLAVWEEVARAAGSRRLVLEVSSTHDAAVRLYRREGFSVLDERNADDPETGRRLHYLHLARGLGGFR